MYLKYCSFSGADDRVDLAHLSAIAKRYPFAEWAILYWPGHTGMPRYPTLEWIERFKREVANSHKAMHLCETALNMFIKRDPDTLALMKGFSRIQLNLGFGKPDPYDPKKLVERIKQSPEWQFIIQHGTGPDVLSLFSDVPDHAILFDASAGTGVSPDHWPAPFEGRFCGYAGGINPGNAEKHLHIISETVPAHVATWIDMESGIRTDNTFDLIKVQKVLEFAMPYAAQPQKRPQPTFPISRA